MEILGIAYLGFESPTYKQWLEYGPEVLGFGVGERRGNDETVYLRMDDRSWRIALHPGEADQVTYIGWEIRHRTAFRAALDKLRAEGIAATPADDETCRLRGVREMVSITDPVGYRHELCYGQKFHPNSFVPGRPHHGFVAEELGVGHIVLITPAYPPELDHFLGEVMGFKWFGSGAGPAPAGFYRAKLNDLSHNIAYIAAPGLRGVHHIGIGVKELDDVGIAYDRVREREIKLQQTLGRHTQDPVVSFYSFTPSGFIVEYLTEGARMHEDSFHEVNPEKLSVWGHQLVGPPLPPTVRPVA